MTDWTALITRLERCGMRHIDIAVACGRSENWVGQLKRRLIAEPPHSVGQILIQLDAQGVAKVTFSAIDGLKTQDIAVRF